MDTLIKTRVAASILRNFRQNTDMYKHWERTGGVETELSRKWWRGVLIEGKTANTETWELLRKFRRKHAAREMFKAFMNWSMGQNVEKYRRLHLDPDDHALEVLGWAAEARRSGKAIIYYNGVEQMGNFISKIKRALANPDAQRGMRDSVVVNVEALRNLVADWERLDGIVQAQHALEQSMKQGLDVVPDNPGPNGWEHSYPVTPRQTALLKEFYEFWDRETCNAGAGQVVQQDFTEYAEKLGYMKIEVDVMLRRMRYMR